MLGWHHPLNGHGFGWTPGVGDGQGGLACCSPWGRRESDTTERLDKDHVIYNTSQNRGFFLPPLSSLVKLKKEMVVVPQRGTGSQKADAPCQLGSRVCTPRVSQTRQSRSTCRDDGLPLAHGFRVGIT